MKQKKNNSAEKRRAHAVVNGNRFGAAADSIAAAGRGGRVNVLSLIRQEEGSAGSKQKRGRKKWKEKTSKVLCRIRRKLRIGKG